MKWEEVKYTLSTAEKNFTKLNTSHFMNYEVSPECRELRDDLVGIRDKVFDENEFDKLEKLGYDFDLTFGLELYELLNRKYHFKLRHASSNEIWRMLQVEIIPDIVFSRWGFNDNRFYKANRRLWLKTLWWYIHLSWNNDKISTFSILENNTTDTIMQLVERPGLGYNTKLYREIMKKYSENSTDDNDSRYMFRRVLILNTARISTISPELSENGIEGYVDGLYKDVMDD